MKALQTAILTLFNALAGGANNSYWLALTGRLFYGKAPAGTPYPYAIFFPVSGISDNSFVTSYRDRIIQFSNFSDNSASALEANDLADKCEALFNGCSLTITGQTLVNMEIESNPGAMPEEQAATTGGTTTAWHAPVDFRVHVKIG